MVVKATCSNCGNELLSNRDFEVVNGEGKTIGMFLGYSRKDGDYWQCENCGQLNNVPQPN